MAPKRIRVRTPQETYGAARRFIVASGTHAAQGDTLHLATLLELSAELEKAMRTAVHGLREQGYSWEEIAQGAGMTKAGAFKRWR